MFVNIRPTLPIAYVFVTIADKEIGGVKVSNSVSSGPSSRFLSEFLVHCRRQSFLWTGFNSGPGFGSRQILHRTLLTCRAQSRQVWKKMQPLKTATCTVFCMSQTTESWDENGLQILGYFLTCAYLIDRKKNCEQACSIRTYKPRYKWQLGDTTLLLLLLLAACRREQSHISEHWSASVICYNWLLHSNCTPIPPLGVLFIAGEPKSSSVCPSFCASIENTFVARSKATHPLFHIISSVFTLVANGSSRGHA